MSQEKYKSHIKKAQTHTTSKGGRYIKPFDLVRSERGRTIVDRHADLAVRKKNARSDSEENLLADAVG